MTAVPSTSSAALRVSIIMANYNGEKYIGAAMESVLRQTLSQIELIVVDDASADASVSIAAHYAAADPRIKLVTTDSNRGPATARNRALAAAKGEWIAIMDSDDVMHPTRLETLIHAAEGDGADMAADDLIVFYGDGGKPSHSFLANAYGGVAFWAGLADYIRFNTFYSKRPGLGYLKPVIRAGELDAAKVSYNESLKIGEDYDLAVKLLAHGIRYRIYPKQLYYYRKHTASVSHRLSEAAIKAMLAADARLEGQLLAKAPDLGPVLAARTRSLETALAFERFITALKARNLAAAAALACQRPRLVTLLDEPARAQLARLRQAIASSRRFGFNTYLSRDSQG
jgi:succinoglycan biosynthesis protein ExoO